MRAPAPASTAASVRGGFECRIEWEWKARKEALSSGFHPTHSTGFGEIPDASKASLNHERLSERNSGFAKPAFTSNDIYEKLFNRQAKVSSIDRIPKPKPKVEKPAKTESERKEESPISSPSEEESSSNDQSADGVEGTMDQKIEQENVAESDSESHDEL